MTFARIPTGTITERERQMLVMLVEGKTCKEIARIVGLKGHSVSMQLGRAAARLGMPGATRVRLAVECLRRGLLTDPQNRHADDCDIHVPRALHLPPGRRGRDARHPERSPTMTVRVKTSALVELLTDLSFTSGDPGDPVGGILLHSASGYADSGEPGRSQLLVGTSTDRFGVGHTWCVAEGHTNPMLWPVLDAAAVVAVFRPLTKGNADHAVSIRRKGDEITVQEDADLFGEGTALTFTLGDLDGFPRGVWDILGRGRFPSQQDPAVPRTDLSPARLTAFAKVAVRRKAPVEIYRTHQLQPVLVQIGSSYRGAAMPVSWYSPGEEDPTRFGIEPSTDLYAADLPPVEDASPAGVVSVDG